MEENQNSNGQMVVTVQGATQKMNISLTQISSSVQSLQNEANALIFNEDHVENIKNFIEKSKKAKKAVADTHSEGKAPFLSAGRAWDTAKKDLTALLDAVDKPVVEKYTALCNDIDRRKREEMRKQQEKERIVKLIDDTCMDFSNRIANCDTRTALNDIERLINLEKSPNRSSKYGDYHKDAIARFDELLIPVLKDQKVKIDEKEKLEKQLADAQNPEKYDELKKQLEQKENEIVQNKVEVQQNALSQTPIEPEEAIVELPSVKASRTDIVSEIIDIEAVFKKRRDLLTIDLKTLEAKKVGKKLQEDGAFGDNDELIVDGIKFKIKKTW